MKPFKSIGIIFLSAIILMAVHVLGIYLVGDIGFMTSSYFWPLFACSIVSILLFVIGIFKLIKLLIKKSSNSL